MNTKAADWVRARARCTVEHYFSEIAKAIRRDVDRFNGEADKQGRQSGFMVAPSEQGGIEVRPARPVHYPSGRRKWETVPTDDPDFVAIGCVSGDVVSARSGGQRITIKPVWNPDSLTCDLMLEGEARSIDWLSQRIIGDFMFESISQP